MAVKQWGYSLFSLSVSAPLPPLPSGVYGLLGPNEVGKTTDLQYPFYGEYGKGWESFFNTEPVSKLRIIKHVLAKMARVKYRCIAPPYDQLPVSIAYLLPAVCKKVREISPFF